jgi:hypothetical protein
MVFLREPPSVITSLPPMPWKTVLPFLPTLLMKLIVSISCPLRIPRY